MVNMILSRREQHVKNVLRVVLAHVFPEREGVCTDVTEAVQFVKEGDVVDFFASGGLLARLQGVEGAVVYCYEAVAGLEWSWELVDVLVGWGWRIGGPYRIQHPPRFVGFW